MLKGKSVLLLIIIIQISLVQIFAQNEPIRVACIGNSITYGGQGANSYPQRTNTLIGDEYYVQNFGISGTTMLKNGDFPYWKESAFHDAQDFDPDIVIILLGTNDSKPQNWAFGDEFYDDYMEFISVFRSNGKDPVIYACYPLPVFQTLAGINEPVVHDEIIPIIDSVITSANTLSIDFYALMKDHSDLVPDGVHPNTEGYNMMAEFTRDELLSMPSGQVILFRSVSMAAELDEEIVLKWKTSENSNVTFDGQSVNESDSVTVIVSEETTYELIAEGEYTDTARITIDFLPPGKIKSFNADQTLLEIGAGDTATIFWDASNGSSVNLDGQSVDTDGTLRVTPEVTTTYTLIATGDITDTSYVTIKLLEADKLNRAFNRTITASSTARGYFIESVVDGDPETFWVSENSISAWINIDLGKDLNINRAEIDWGDIYATTYHLQLMAEDGSITSIYSNTAGDGGIDDITGLEGFGRYLRILGIAKNSTDSGYVVNEIEVYATSGITGVESGNTIIPDEFSLDQNYPNPFNPSTSIEYSIPSSFGENEQVKLSVLDILGREVAVLVDENQSPGNYNVNFNADLINGGLSSGIYFYNLDAGNYSTVRKMILMK